MLLGYVLVRLFMRDYYFVPEYNYLTPLYSPCISVDCVPGSAHFGAILPSLPFWLPLPIIVFPILLGFRATCYYYRKAVYRSLLLSPPGCAVREPHRGYRGESRFPLIVMNSHRYFFYAASILLLINTYDAVLAFFPASPAVSASASGSIILVANVALLWAYTLSCHSCRHIARRPAQALLPAPGPLPAVVRAVADERPAHAVRVDLAGQRDADRRVRHGGRGRLDHRPAVLQLRVCLNGRA